MIMYTTESKEILKRKAESIAKSDLISLYKDINFWVCKQPVET